MQRHIFRLEFEDGSFQVISYPKENHYIKELTLEDLKEKRLHLSGKSVYPFKEVKYMVELDEGLNFKNRFYLFAGYSYYPLGGMEDLQITSESKEELKGFMSIGGFFSSDGSFEELTWAHVYDSWTNQIIWELDEDLEKELKDLK